MLRPFFWDVETKTFSPGNMAPPLVCVALDAGTYQSLMRWDQCCDYMAELLLRPDVLFVGHSVAYDFMCLAEEYPQLHPLIFDAYEADRVTDTEVRQRLIDIALGCYRKFTDIDDEIIHIDYELDDLAVRHLGRKLDKNTWRLRYGEFRDANLPVLQWPEGAQRYPLEDVRATKDVYGVQEQWSNILEDQYRQTRSAYWLKLMTTWGIRTDLKGVEQLAYITKRDLEVLTKDLVAGGLIRPPKRIGGKNPRLEPGKLNQQAVRDRVVAVYTAQGRPIPLTKEKKDGSGGGNVATDRIACNESGDELLIKKAKRSKLVTVQRKEIPALERGIYHPIHSYFQVLVETGRVSSSNPQLSNLPRKGGVRECFVPRPQSMCEADGCRNVFVSADYGMLELCTLAEVCYTVLGWSCLGDQLNADKDPHTSMAARILGIPYDTAFGIRSGTVFDAMFPESVIDDNRQTGKVANFGFPGGLGAAALVAFALKQYNVRLTEDQARWLKRLWLEELPEMRDYFRWVGGLTEKADSSICHLFSNRWRGKVNYTNACNSFFQGLGADVAKSAGWLIARGCYIDRESPLWGYRMVNFVHDEFVLEGPEHRAHEAALELSRLMVEAARPWLPHVKIKAEPALSRRYSKSTKAQWHNGRLVPWGDPVPESEAA